MSHRYASFPFRAGPLKMPVLQSRSTCADTVRSVCGVTRLLVLLVVEWFARVAQNDEAPKVSSIHAKHALPFGAIGYHSNGDKTRLWGPCFARIGSPQSVLCSLVTIISNGEGGCNVATLANRPPLRRNRPFGALTIGSALVYYS